MNKKQAFAMLSLIADLYIVIQSPDEPPQPTVNGKGTVREAEPMTAD